MEEAVITPLYVKLMSTYTLWQNRSIYDAASTLSDAARHEHPIQLF